jgi:peptidoglycan/LPS O-acetylase OafA/YrhL
MVKVYDHLLSHPLDDGKIPVYLKGLNFILLILISWLSWIIIEKPILNLKKWFIY